MNHGGDKVFKKGKKSIEPIRETSIVRARKNSFLNISIKNYIASVEDEYNKKNLIPLIFLEIMNRDNKIFMTLDELSKEINYPKTTLSTLITKLRNMDFLVRVRNGVYMINPMIAFRGNAQDRERLIDEYQKIKNDWK